MKNKRYLIFGWERYEASGGLGDIVASFDTIIECANYCRDQRNAKHSKDYWEIYDRIDDKEYDVTDFL